MHGEVCIADAVNWSHSLNRGLVSWYLCLPDQQRGLYWRDLCGRNHGTLTNGPTWQGARGRIGGYGCLQFDGSNDNCTTSKASIPNNAPFTVSCWFRHDTAGVDIIWSQNSGGAIALGYNSTNWLYNNLTHSTDSYETWNFTRDALWHHLTLSDPNTDNANDAELYIDGLPLAHSGGAAGWSPGAANFIIGGRASGTSGWQGAIDDVRIYSRALSDRDVFELYEESRRSYPGSLNRLPSRRYTEQAAVASSRLLHLRRRALA